jgi:hypothetical protein
MRQAPLTTRRPAGRIARQLSVLFSIDVFELIDQDVIVPFDQPVTAEDRDWLASLYPALMKKSYRPRFGLVDQVRSILGASYHNWLGDAHTIMGCIIVMTVWTPCCQWPRSWSPSSSSSGSSSRPSCAPASDSAAGEGARPPAGRARAGTPSRGRENAGSMS